MAIQKPTETATIDSCLVVLTEEGANGKSYGITSNTNVEVTPQTETTEAVKCIVKGVLKAQKPEKTIVTGHDIVLTDNLTILEAVQMIQGGAITTDPTSKKITKYEPPAVGEETARPKLTVDIYTAVMDQSDVVGYEKTTYPNCVGDPVAFHSQDNAFRTPSYTLKSRPGKGQSPYTIEYVDELPEVTEAANASYGE